MSLVNFSCLRNVSQDRVTEIGWIVDHPDGPSYVRGNGYGTAVIVSLVLLIGMPWNLFVISTIVRKKLYNSPTIMLLLNLAITNLLLSLLVMPFNIITGFSGEYLFGNTDEVRCRVCQTGIFLVILPWVSMHTLTLMSVDRFIFLKWPLDYGFIINPWRLLIAIIIIWMFCTVIALPPLFGFGEIKFSFTVSTCVPQLVGRTHVAPNLYYVLLIGGEAVLLAIVVIVMYIWVICIVQKSILVNFRRSVRNRLNSQGQLKPDVRAGINNQKRSVQLRLVRAFIVIFTANLFTWLPMLALALAGTIVGPGTPTILYNLAYLSFLSQTVIHPILQACLIRELRMTITGYLRYCGIRRLNGDESTRGSSSTTKGERKLSAHQPESTDHQNGVTNMTTPYVTCDQTL